MDDKDDKRLIEKIPHGRRLPYWQKPRSAIEAIAKIKNAGREWKRFYLSRGQMASGLNTNCRTDN